MLTTSGDGSVDATLGEECDPKQYPPIVLAYDENITGDYVAQKYPDSTYTATTIPNGKVSWIPADTIKDESGDTARVEYMAEGYYTCSSASFLTTYNGCGDGVPSNGPPEVSVFNDLHSSN